MSLIDNIKSIVKPRKRTNAKVTAAVARNPIPAQLGAGRSAGNAKTSPNSASAGGGGFGGGVFYEIERDETDIDGCRVAVRSKLQTQDAAVTLNIYWLKPGDSRIKVIT